MSYRADLQKHLVIWQMSVLVIFNLLAEFADAMVSSKPQGFGCSRVLVYLPGEVR